jgi:hypothetical protein
MNRNISRRGLLPIIIFLAVSAASPAQSLIASKPSPASGSSDLGLIFCANNIFLDLESYEAGIGAKMAFNDFALRGSIDLGYFGATQAFSVNLGLAVESHFMPGAISPYLGAYTRIGYNIQPGVLSVVPVSLGGIIGVEVFIFDFLSIFAEYALAVDLTLTTDLATATTTFDYVVDTKMGNNSMIGVVVYFQREKAKK